MATIELEDAFADDSLEMDEVGDKFRVAADLQARIVATGPITSAPPSQITVTPAATGAATEVARADHVHDVAVATPTALTVGGSNAAGTSVALARADHRHALPAFGSPVAEAIGSAAADGVADTFARSDHVHAMPAAGAPAAEAIGSVQSAGVAVTLARSDHVHAMPAAGTPVALAASGANAAGSAATLARSDHVHALPAFPLLTSTAPADVQVQTAAVGAATDAARRDHVHNVLTGAPAALAIGSAQAAGTATTLARSDHVHAMPAAGAPAALAIGSAQATGAAATLARSDHVHATPGLATAGADGYMPAAAMSQLAGIPTTVVPVVGSITAAAGNIYLVDISGNTVTVTLPPAATNAGKQLIIKHAKGDPPNHLFVGGGGATIDGRPTIDLDMLYQWVGLVCDGVAWFTYADSLVANKLQVSGDAVFKTIGAIAANQVLRRNSADSIVGGPVTMDNSGNLLNVGLINNSPLIGLTAVAPTRIENQAANAGSSGAAARADHIHDVLFAAPIALAVGGANALGSGPSLAFSDHKHALPSFGTASGTFCEGNDARLTAALVNPAVNGFRLAPTADDSIPADGTFSTIYLAPVESDLIALYTAGAWALRQASGLSYVLAARTADRPFDLFAWWDTSGTPAVKLEAVDWSSGTARATALVKQNGVWTKSADATRRYLGTVRPRSATTYKVARRGGIDTGSCGIDYWNQSNRRQAGLRLDGSGYAYSTAAYRQANGSVNAQVDVVSGLGGDLVAVWLASIVTSTSGAIVGACVAIGRNSTTVPESVRTQAAVSSGTNTITAVAQTAVTSAQGIETFTWMEMGNAGVTFHGNPAVQMQSGLTATIWY